MTMSNTFIKYDWAAIEAALDAGDTTAQDERAALNKLFHLHKLRKDKEAEQKRSDEAVRALREANRNTPVYYTGNDERLMSGRVQWMLKTGDLRSRMEVQVKAKGGQAVTWRIPYDQLSLDWRRQARAITRIAGIDMKHYANEQPW